jgi:uncharacterized protein YoxC
MPLSYMVYGSVAILFITLVIYLINSKKRK